MKAFQAAETPDEVVILFQRNGIEVPVEIAQELFETNIQDCELSENALDSVAGGGGGLWGSCLSNVFWRGGDIGGRLAGIKHIAPIMPRDVPISAEHLAVRWIWQQVCKPLIN